MNLTHEQARDFGIHFSNNGITKYTGKSLSVVIPETIGGEEILHIDDYAFHNKGLKSVTFNSNLEIIGDESFSQNSITEIILPNSLKEIHQAAFKCNQISGTVTIPTDTILMRASLAYNQIELVIYSISKKHGDLIPFYENPFAGNPRVQFSKESKGKPMRITDYLANFNKLIAVNNKHEFGKEVTEIGSYSFTGSDCRLWVVPKKIVSIHDRAFVGSGLKKVAVVHQKTIEGNPFNSELLEDVYAQKGSMFEFTHFEFFRDIKECNFLHTEQQPFLSVVKNMEKSSVFG